MLNKKLFYSLLLAGALSLFFVDKHLSSLILYSSAKKWAKMVSFCISPGLNALIWPLLFLVQIIRKKGWYLCYIASSVGFGYLCMYPIKILTGRLRPLDFFAGNIPAFNPLCFDMQYHSLPSGHAVVSMALFTSLANLFPTKAKLLLCFGLVLPITRILLGKHFLGDILFGEAIGYLSASFFFGKNTHIIYQFFGKIFGVKHGKDIASR